MVGPSGSGKSTIAKLIASFWDVKGGCITVGGEDVRNISAEHYHKLVAYVSQDNFLFDDTVRENIRMGKPDATDAEVEQARATVAATISLWGLKTALIRWSEAAASFGRRTTAAFHRPSHDEGCADQILVVDKVQIVQRGTHEALMTQNGIYRRFISGREQAVGWKL